MEVGRYDLFGPASSVHTCITITGKSFPLSTEHGTSKYIDNKRMVWEVAR